MILNPPVKLALPALAFVCSVEGLMETYVAATTKGKARHICVEGLKEAGYTESGQYKNVRVRRAPTFDNWARIAKRGCFSHDAVMDQSRRAGVSLV